MNMQVLGKGRLIVGLDLIVVVNVVLLLGDTSARTGKALAMFGTTVKLQAALDATRKSTDEEYRVMLS